MLGGTGGHAEEAEGIFLDAYDIVNEAWGPNNYPALESADHLMELYQSMGQSEEAQHWASVGQAIRESAE